MQNNQEVKFYEIFKKLAVIGAAFVMSISVTVSASAAELSYTDSTGKYKMIGINESDGDYRHTATIKTDKENNLSIAEVDYRVYQTNE